MGIVEMMQFVFVMEVELAMHANTIGVQICAVKPITKDNVKWFVFSK